MVRFRYREKKGFTLVELALVLVIIGLLITGILKGEALIRNAKVKNVVNQKNTLTAAVYTYFDRFNYFPGDANVANIPITGHNDAGNANGQINNGTNEVLYLFWDLSLANIINGGYSGTNGPNNTYGGTTRIQWVGAMNQNCVVFTSIPVDVAQEIDTKNDDGVWNAGNIRSNTAYTNAAVKTLTWGM